MEDKPMNKEQLLEFMFPVMELYKDYALGNKRIRDKEMTRIRIQSANALTRLVDKYNAVLTQIELEEIQRELMELRDEFKANKERYQ